MTRPSTADDATSEPPVQPTSDETTSHRSVDPTGERTHPSVRRANRVGTLLDEAITVPGTNVKIGLDPILGIVPGVGDGFAALLSLYIVFEGYRAGVSRSTLLRMLGYIGVDTVIGSVPVLGPVFDTFWKANTWNARLLRSHVESSQAT